jgi:hypothetical protein
MYGTDAEAEPETLKLSNEFLDLEFFSDTAQIALTDKASGAVWRSSPEGVETDVLADGITKQTMLSQFTVSYADYTGTGMSLNNYRYSVERSLYEYAEVDGGIEVNYTVGDIAREFKIPIAAPEWRLKEFTDKMERADSRRIDDTYRLVDINKLRPSDNKDELLALYPTLAEEKIYILRDSLKDAGKEAAETILYSYGYTDEDWTEDMARYGVTSEADKPVFNVTLRYELDGNSLKVSVPFEKISYRSNYPITDIQLLPFFGAGGMEDEGYLFVPDGSGALINFNNGRQNQLAYNVNMYGWDEAMYRDAIITDTKAAYPVYGIYNNGNTAVCIIEDGSAYSSVRADVSGRNCSYNSVSASFKMLHSASMDVSSKSDRAVIMYEKVLPAGEQISMRIVPCKEPGYVGMAKEYRNYLLEKHGDFVGNTTEEVPIAVELIGSVTKTQHRLGIPFDLPLKLTSYEEAKVIIDEIAQYGWANAQIKATGFFNGGVDHTTPDKIRTISELGSGSGFESVVAAADNWGYKLYLDGNFMFVMPGNIFGGFSVNSDAARFISRERVEQLAFTPIWYGEALEQQNTLYLSRPAYMNDIIDKFTAEASKYNINGISFRSLGYKLAGDYYEKRLVSREASMNMQAAKLAQLASEGKSTLIPYGSAYASPYATFVTDIPVTDQAYGITDVPVPFYQIALHSYVPYTGKAINLAEDYSLYLLKAIEGGAGLYFSFFKEQTAVLQELGAYSEYYSNEYDKWVGDADKLYKDFKRDFTGLFNQTIEGHEILADMVTVTEYADGTKVYVNTNSFDYNEGGITVPAMNYYVERS